VREERGGKWVVEQLDGGEMEDGGKWTGWRDGRKNGREMVRERVMLYCCEDNG